MAIICCHMVIIMSKSPIIPFHILQLVGQHQLARLATGYSCRTIYLPLVGNMVGILTEQRINMKFLVQLGKSTTETYSFLQQVYGNECMQQTQVFERYSKKGKKIFVMIHAQDILQLRKKMKTSRNFICADCHFSIHVLAETIRIDEEI